MTYFHLFIKILLGGGLGISVISALGVILSQCVVKSPKARIFLHIGWLFMGLFMWIGFLMSSLLLPLGVSMTEGCGWLENYLN